MNKEILRLEGVTVAKGGITYLNNFSMWIKQSEILGLLSIDQQGIEQLIELIVSNSPIKYGKVFWNEELINDSMWTNVQTNQIHVINEKLRLIPDLTIADNVFVLRKNFKKLVINEAVLEREVQRILDEIQISIKADTLAKDLKPFERCVIELVKAVVSGAKLIIVQHIDEMIGQEELARFYQLMRYYERKGIAFLCISHHHEDVFRIAERVVIYERGEIVKVLYSEQMNEENLAPYIQKIEKHSVTRNRTNKPVLELKNVKTRNADKVDIRIYSGRCTTILEQGHKLTGSVVPITEEGQHPFEGEVFCEGRAVKSKKEFRQLQDKIMIVPEDPTNNFLFIDQSFMYNLAFLADRKIKKSVVPARVLYSIRKEWKKVFDKYMDKVDLLEMPLADLYSLVYYKVILYRPQIVYLIQPFAGADMNLRIHIAKLIIKLKEENIAVVLLSNYVTDILAVADEVI